MIILAGSGFDAQTDTSVGISVLDDLALGSVDEAQAKINLAEQKIKEAESGAVFKNNIEKIIKQIEKGKKSYREVFSDVYFMGDSLMDGLKVYSVLNSSHLITQVSAAFGHLEANFDKIVEIRPPVLVLHYGLNMIGVDEAHAKSFVSQYAKIIEKLKKALPGTRIIVSLMFPVDTSKAKAAKFKMINKYNELTIEMCKKEKVEYLNSAKVVKANSDCRAKDGIHMSKKFYHEWLKFIMREKEIY